MKTKRIFLTFISGMFAGAAWTYLYFSLKYNFLVIESILTMGIMGLAGFLIFLHSLVEGRA